MTGQLQKRNRRMVTDILELGGRQRGAPVRTERELLTNSWTRDVETVSAAIAGFDTTNRRHAGECKVMLFEIAGDSQLHVNVIHTHERSDVRGWAGPGQLADGCVYNRRFADTPPQEIIRHIREMVFA